MKIGILGQGGRESALQEAVSRSALATGVIAIPVAPFEQILQQAKDTGIDLLVVGPERPLVGGLKNFLAKEAPQLKVFGPDALGAELEGSKIYMKTRCRRWGVPTADFDFSGCFRIAKEIIKRKDFRIIKADGLFDGKGAIVTKSEEEALAVALSFGDSKLVLEERLEGPEVSIMAFCDGMYFRMLAPARDYKRVRAGSDLMTGGMGAYSPLPDLTPTMFIDIQTRIVQKVVAGMASEGRPIRGVLKFDLMITKDGPKVLEINTRFGDPETQVVLPRLDCDVVPYLLACTEHGGLRTLPALRWKSGAAVCVCYASKGYPTVGHRLGSVVGFGATIALAREDAYRKLALIPGIENMEWRDDIAAGV